MCRRISLSTRERKDRGLSVRHASLYLYRPATGKASVNLPMTRHTHGLAIFSRYADEGLRQSIEHTARATYSFGINGNF